MLFDLTAAPGSAEHAPPGQAGPVERPKNLSLLPPPPGSA
jgi:hypothetical protein